MVGRVDRKLSAFHIFEGLQDGLSHFSGSSRVALLYTMVRNGPMRVYDPQNLLRGHEPKLKELYIDTDHWRKHAPSEQKLKNLRTPFPDKNLGLAGLVSFGGWSLTIFYQMWFTDHHLNMCSTGPTERWLEHAVWLLCNDIDNEKACYIDTSGYVLREYSTHAVRDHIVDEMNIAYGMDIQIRNYPILDAILGISETKEEGEWPEGKIVFVEPRHLPEINFIARFPYLEQPSLKSYKHVRKLLKAVENSDRRLVSDGNVLVGITDSDMPNIRITADFRQNHGFLNLSGKPICSFSDGRFQSSNRRANLVQLEEIILESDIGDFTKKQTLFQLVKSIVHHAEDRSYGCTLVIDLNDQPIEMAGQLMETPLDLTRPHLLELAKALSNLDGAIHISSELLLHAFGCILDGKCISGEDRARGARFNSALRFTAKHRKIVVVVVSSDRPVSLIQEGVELNAQCRWKPVSACLPSPPTLVEWLDMPN